MRREVVSWRSKEIWVEGSLLRIAHLDGEKYTSAGDPEEIAAVIAASGRRTDLFTFLQHPPDTQPRYPYVMEWDNLAVLPVTSFDNWWNNQIRSVARNRARQAEKKGVIVTEIPFSNELLLGIVAIHNESPLRQGRRFPHYGMTVEGARRYAGTFLDRTRFLAAYFNNQIIGFLKLTLSDTGVHACIVNVLSMMQHRDKAPSNALIAKAVQVCASQGTRYLVYENFTYGKKKNDSLSQFKFTNGFRQMDLPRYYIPLTPLGRFALGAGLHRRLSDYCPDLLLERYRNLRRWWYGIRFAKSAGAAAGD